MLSEQIKNIAEEIGYFYLLKNNNDYSATADELIALRLNKIEVKNDMVFLETSRPGLIIGKRGENFKQLEDYLKETISFSTLYVVESKDDLLYYLIPQEQEPEPEDYTYQCDLDDLDDLE